jgi:protein-L-isoaspartate O-methyltransferase
MDDLNDTTSTRVSKAMRSLPRDHFIEMSDPSVVLGRSIPPTNAVSEILHHARVCPEHKVLQIGTGAGYVAALLSKLAAQVVTIEINPSISRFAQSRFNKLGLAISSCASRTGRRTPRISVPTTASWSPARG